MTNETLPWLFVAGFLLLMVTPVAIQFYRNAKRRPEIRETAAMLERLIVEGYELHEQYRRMVGELRDKSRQETLLQSAENDLEMMHRLLGLAENEQLRIHKYATRPLIFMELVTIARSGCTIYLHLFKDVESSLQQTLAGLLDEATDDPTSDTATLPKEG